MRLADEDDSPDTVIDEDTTSSLGYFRLCFENADLDGSSDTLVVRVFAAYSSDETSDPSNWDLYVEKDYVYQAAWSSVVNTSTNKAMGTLDLSSDSDEEKAFWIKNDVQDGFDYLDSEGAIDEADVEMIWPHEETFADSSFFCYDAPLYCAEPRVYLEEDQATGSNGRDITLHEYGHRTMSNLYGDWMPAASLKYFPGDCSDHSIGMAFSAQDQDCWWQEDWATYFAMAVQGSSTFMGYNLETPPSSWLTVDYTEGLIIASLWDVYDSSNTGETSWDGVSVGFDDGIDIMTSSNRQDKITDHLDDWYDDYSNDCDVEDCRRSAIMGHI